MNQNWNATIWLLDLLKFVENRVIEYNWTDLREEDLPVTKLNGDSCIWTKIFKFSTQNKSLFAGINFYRRPA